MAKRNKRIRELKLELAPMISNFLFFEQDSNREEREEYISMKLDIRERLKDPISRVVMTQILMDLRKDVSGDARKRVFDLYQDLGLDQDAFEKLKSWRWVRISQGIHDLTELRVDRAYPYIRKFINDRRSVIRKQAQLASVTLRQEGITYFLDTAKYRISEWQQLKLLELLQRREAYDPPRFKEWLTSENSDVVLFALRLIRHYRQTDSESGLIALLNHSKEEIKKASLECIRDFCFSQAKPVLKEIFSESGEESRILILDALSQVGEESDIEFVSGIASKDSSFIVRSKAKSVINTIAPDDSVGAPETEVDEKSEALPEGETIQESEALPESEIIQEGEVIPESKAVSESETIQESEVIPESEAVPESETIQESEVIPESETIHDSQGIPEVEQEENTNPDPIETRFEIELRHVLDQVRVPEEDISPTAFDLEELLAKADKDISDEELKIFDLCLLEELEDILGELEPDLEPKFLPLDFLPFVSNEVAPTVKQSKPKIDSPDWINLNFLPEVIDQIQADKTVSASSDAQEELLEILFTPDIENPKATSTTETPQQNNTAADECDLDFIFEWDNEIIPPKPKGFNSSKISGESIFKEYFEHYDIEAQLILLEEIPIVGGVKELKLLQELGHKGLDAIQNKALEAYTKLSEKLKAAGEKSNKEAE